MLLPHDKIIGLPVQTQTGRQLGKVSGLIIETSGQDIRQYAVKTAGMANLFAKELLVGREQVIALTEEKLVVEDSAAPLPKTSAIAAAS